MVSSASIDVITTASPYSEERTQYGLGFEYLRGKVTYAASFSNSERERLRSRHRELLHQPGHVRRPDHRFAGHSAAAGTTSRAAATRHFADEVDRRIYGVDVSQIASRKLILGLVLGDDHRGGIPQQPLPPGALRATRAGASATPTSRALPAHAHRQRAGLRGALLPALSRRTAGRIPLVQRHLGHRLRTPSRSPTRTRSASGWMFDVHYRYYMQNAADFYSDLFPRQNFQNFLARDKELSTMNSQTLGFGVGYEFTVPRSQFLEQGDGQPEVRPHAVQLRRFPRPAAPRASRPAPSRCTASTRTSSGSSSPAGSRGPSGGFFRRRQSLRIEHAAVARARRRRRRPAAPRSARGPARAPSRTRSSSGPR